MAKNQKINLDAANLLTVNAKVVEKAFKDAARAALLKNRQANNSVAVWRNAKSPCFCRMKYCAVKNKSGNGLGKQTRHRARPRDYAVDGND
jgi:hypothetical protein